jgi:YtxH-like protein
MNMNKITDYLDKDAIVSRLGYEARTSTGEKLVSALGLFGVGVLVGAGVALLLAPKSGRDLRNDIMNKVSGDVEDFKATTSTKSSTPATRSTSTPSSGFGGSDQRTI